MNTYFNTIWCLHRIKVDVQLLLRPSTWLVEGLLLPVSSHGHNQVFPVNVHTVPHVSLPYLPLFKAAIVLSDSTVLARWGSVIINTELFLCALQTFIPLELWRFQQTCE